MPADDMLMYLLTRCAFLAIVLLAIWWQFEEFLAWVQGQAPEQPGNIHGHRNKRP